MPAVGFSVDTIMSETLNTDYVTVIAGATAEAPMQPVLRVMTSDPRTGITTTQDYLLPSGRGQAHLDRISGQTLSVSGAGKTRSYSFDVSTGTLG